MEEMLEILKGTLGTAWRFAVFVAASILFLPAFLIVTLLQDYWTKALGELFKL